MVGISNTGPLKNLWSSQGTSTDNNKLIRLDSLVDWFRKGGLGLMITTWLILDADSARWGSFIEENPDNFRICENMKIGVVSILQEGMDVAVCSILTFTVGRHVTLPVLMPVSEMSFWF